jgi:hypothetical protein
MLPNLPFKYFQVKNTTQFETKDGKIFRKKEKYHQISQFQTSNKDFLRVSNATNINNVTFESDVYSTDLEKINTSYDSLNVLNETLDINNNNFVNPQQVIKVLDFMSVEDIPILLQNEGIFDIDVTNFSADAFVVPIIDNSQVQSSIDQYVNVGNTIVKSDYLYTHDKTDSLNLKVVNDGSVSYVINEKVIVTNNDGNGGNNSSGGQYKEFWA